MIKICAADKLQLNRGPDDLALVEVKSNGERTIFKDNDLSIPTALTLNGRLFISPRDHLDALTPLPEQEGATEGLEMDLEALPTKDLAYHMTLFDWDLFWAVHEYELLYHTFGRHHFNKVRQPSPLAGSTQRLSGRLENEEEKAEMEEMIRRLGISGCRLFEQVGRRIKICFRAPSTDCVYVS